MLPRAAHLWPVATLGEATLANLSPIIEAATQILLIGCGKRLVSVPHALRQELRAHGIVIDAMDTGAACRTYNVLLVEDRRVAAALLPSV